MGSYSEIPSSVEVGVPFQVSVWYAWEEVPANPAIGSAAGRATPEGYYAWPDDLGPAAPPAGYAGSEVVIRLPEELELLGHEPDLAKRLLWIDGNGRSTYEYSGTLAYGPGSGPQNLLLNVVLRSPVAYADTQVYADLGLSERDAAPRVWTINNAGAGRASISTDPQLPDPPPPVRSFAEELREIKESPAPTPGPAAYAAAARAAGATGGAGGAGGAAGPGAAGGAGAGAPVPALRHTYVYPPPVVTPLPESEMPDEARRLGAGGASATDQVIVWGQFRAIGRDGTPVDVANAVVCLFDRRDDGTLAVIRHTGVDACRFTDPEGRYEIAVPSTDPDGDGGPDIVARLLAFNNFASVIILGSGSATAYRYDTPVQSADTAGFLNLQSRTLPPTHQFNSAYIALSEITEAHEFFESEFGYDVPRVFVTFGPSALYFTSVERIELAGQGPVLSGRPTVLHEYGHHVHSSVYGQNRLPYTEHCRPHVFHVPSSASCAWIEGWANFVPALVDGSPIINRSGITTWDIESGQIFVNDRLRPFGHGDAVEGRISSLLWDLHDFSPERGDTVSGGTQMIWDAFRGSTPASSELPADTVHEFRDDWEARGYPSLGEAFALNTIPSLPPQPASLTVHAEAGGAPKSGAGERHASPGQSVVVTLGLSAPAPGGDAPTASFFGGAASTMSPVGSGGTLWRSAHAVTPSTPEGTAVFRVMAAGTEYTPASITSGGNVAVDTTAPAPEAEFTGSRSVVLDFGEPLLSASVAPSAFAVTPATGTAPQVTALHAPGSSRVILDLDTPVAAGTHAIAVPATLTDMAGNAYAGGALTVESTRFGAVAPSYSVDAGSIRPTSSGTEIAIEFSQGVTGSTSPGEWTVVLYGASRTYTSTLPVTFVSVGGSFDTGSTTVTEKITRLVLQTNIPMPQSALTLDVRYTPGMGNSNRLTGEAALQNSERAAQEDRAGFRGISVEARFVDPRTVRLSLDRPLAHSGGPLPFVDSEKHVAPSGSQLNPVRGTLGFRGAVTAGLSPTLGDTVVEYEPGSRDVTLHSSRPAAASATHHVVLPPGNALTSISNYGPLRLAAIQGGGYSGPLLPRGDLAASNMDTSGPRILSAYIDTRISSFAIVFTKPLDAESLSSAQFRITPSGSTENVFNRFYGYIPGSLRLDLQYQQTSSAEHTATIPASIRGENGVPVSGPLSVSAIPSSSPKPGIESAEFVSSRELTVGLSRPIDPASAEYVTVSGLGAVTQEYGPRSLDVTLRTERPAANGATHTVSLLPGIRDYTGAQFFGGTLGTVATRGATYTAPADTTPPAVITAWTISGTPDSIRVLFDEDLSSPATSAFAVRRVGTSADLEITASYDALGEGGSSRVDLGLGNHKLLEGARYRVTVPPVSDGSNTSERTTVTVERSSAPAALDAEFTGRNSLRLGVSEPLDPDTVGGITVVGLGDVAIEYARGSTDVFLRTAGFPVDGMAYEIRVPASVTDTGGTSFSDDGAGGPLQTTVVPVTYDDTTEPAAVGAERLTQTTTAVIFDEDVTFADTSRPGLRAAHWTVSSSPGGSLDVGVVEFPLGMNLITSLASTELIPYDSGRTLVLTHAPAPPRSAVSVSYAPGGDGGAVIDTASPPNALAEATVPAADATPPSFTARTLTPSSTVVEFTRSLGGFTAASEWGVDGLEPTSISHAGAPAASRVFVPQGTGSITLAHEATEGPAAVPLVEYAAPDSTALRAGTERLGSLATIAADGIAPAVARADFVGRSAVLLTFTEPLDTATVSVGAFSVTAPGSSTNLLAARDAVTHHAGSPVVLLRLGAGAAQSEHTITVAASVTDANGVAYAAPASPITATPPQGAPASPFTAQTASRTQTTVTFDPSASGATSISEWTVGGMPVTGIVITVQDSQSVVQSTTLAAGTTGIALTHRALGSTGATPAVAYAPPASPLMSGGAAMGAHIAIAADGAGPEETSTRTASRTVTEVTFSEPVQFRGTGAADRAGKWAVSDGSSLAVSSVAIKPGTQGTTIAITHAPNSGSAARPNVSYTPTGNGSLEDAAGNDVAYAAASDPETATDGVAPSAFAHFGTPITAGMPFRILVWLDEVAAGQELLARYLVPFSTDTRRPAYLDMPGLALASEDGSDVPVYLGSVATSGVPDDPAARRDLGTAPKSLLSLFLLETPVTGAPYMLTIPPTLSDTAGNAYGETLELVHGMDTAGPALERAGFTGPRTLYAEFDEPLLRTSVNTGPFSVKASGTNTELLASVAPYVEHSRRVTLTLNRDAVEGTAYAVAATAGLRDARGNVHVPGTPAMATYDATPPTASKAVFVDRHTLEVSVSEPLDIGTVRSIRATGPDFGIFDIEYEAGSQTVTLNTLSLRTTGMFVYPEARVTIPATVTDANGVAFEPTTLFTSHNDMVEPVPHTAVSLSSTSTLVLFSPVTDRIRLGEGSTPVVRAAHWTVAETQGTADAADDTPLTVTDARIASDWRAILLSHDPSSGSDADLSVRYVAGANDAGRVRDWADPPNIRATDATLSQYADRSSPGAASLMLALTHDGTVVDPALPRYANAMDTITATLALDEPSGANTPTIEILGTTVGMAAAPAGQTSTWTHAATVPGSGAAQGELAFEVRAWDASGNVVSLGPTDLPADRTRITIDTMPPTFGARTASSGVTVVEFAEPVSGLLVAADWAVGGEAATGASPSPATPPSPALLLSGATSVALWHGPLADTSGEPTVTYARQAP